MGAPRPFASRPCLERSLMYAEYKGWSAQIEQLPQATGQIAYSLGLQPSDARHAQRPICDGSGSGFVQHGTRSLDGVEGADGIAGAVSCLGSGRIAAGIATKELDGGASGRTVGVKGCIPAVCGSLSRS
eukprot:5607873-Prymnesium_polylepis.3